MTPDSRSARRTPSPATPDPATALAQDLTLRFELGPPLGRGAFGAVHRARERVTGREVALKLLQAGSGLSGVERFVREATVAAGLEHPGIVKVHAVGTFAARPCIVYELVEGRSLAAAARTLGLRARVELVRDVARAVGHAHRSGIVHRDLKPDNVLVDASGRVRVTDFGIAALDGADRLTRTGAMVGTPTHMAPEQFEGRGHARPAPTVDVWALGVVLYELLTGRLPFEGENLIALAGAVDAARPTRPREIDPGIHPAVEAVCLLALARDPARRPVDGLALADALEAALEGRAPARHAVRRRSVVAAAASVVALAALVVGVAASRRAPSAPALADWPAPAAVHEQATGEKATGAQATGAQATGAQATGAQATGAQATERASEAVARPYVARRLGVRAVGADRRWALWLDDARVLTASRAERVALWDVHEDRQLRNWPLFARCAVRLPAGDVLLFDDIEMFLRLDPRGDLALCAQQVRGAVEQLVVVGERVAALVPERDEVLLFDPSGRRPGVTLRCERARSLASSPDGTLLAVGTGENDPDVVGASGSVLLFDLTNGAEPPAPREVPVPGRAKSVAFTADGRRLFVGTSRGQLLLYDALRGEVLAELHSEDVTDTSGLARLAHAGDLVQMALSPDGRRLFSCARLRGQVSCELRTWDVSSGDQVGAPERLSGLHPESLVVAPGGGGLLISMVGGAGGVHLRPLTAPPPARVVERLAAGKGVRWGLPLDERRVLTGGGGDLARVWDVTSGEELALLPMYAYCAVRTPDGGAIVADSKVLVRYDPTFTERTLLLHAPKGLDSTVRLALAGARLLLLWEDGSARLLDANTGRELSRFHPEGGRWVDMALSSDGARLLLSQQDVALTGDAATGALFVHDIADATRPSPATRVPSSGVATHVRFSPDGRWALAGTTEGQLLAVDLTRAPPRSQVLSSERGARCVGLSAGRDGRTVLAAVQLSRGRAEVRLQSLTGGQAASAPLRLEGQVSGLELSPGGGFVVVSTDGGGVLLRAMAQ